MLDAYYLLAATAFSLRHVAHCRARLSQRPAGPRSALLHPTDRPTCHTRRCGSEKQNSPADESIEEDRSILDAIAPEAGQLNRGLGARDRQRLSDYLDNIREIERRIQRTEEKNSARSSWTRPLGVPDSFEDYVGLLFDIDGRGLSGRPHARLHAS